MAAARQSDDESSYIVELVALPSAGAFRTTPAQGDRWRLEEGGRVWRGTVTVTATLGTVWVDGVRCGRRGDATHRRRVAAPVSANEQGRASRLGMAQLVVIHSRVPARG